MATDLVELTKRELTPRAIEGASTLTGESPDVTERALETVAPTLVAGLAGTASSVAGADRLLVVIEEAGLTGTLGNVVDRLGGGGGSAGSVVQMGKDMLGRLFGDRAGPLVDATASASGMKRSSMASLMGLVTPLVLGVIGREVDARHLDAAGLAGLLREQKGQAARALPPGVAEAIAGSNVEEATERIPGRRAEVAVPAPVSPLRRLWPLLLAVPIALLIGLGTRKREIPRTTIEPARTTAPAGIEAAPPVAGAGPVAEQLTIFLASPSAAAEVPRRFVFEDLTFDSGTSEISPRSVGAIDAVATVLKQNPNVEIAIHGHTDDTGDPAQNHLLSQRRAEQVKAALVARGVAPQRIETAGYGGERPIAANDTEQNKARNRRTEVVVTRR